MDVFKLLSRSAKHSQAAPKQTLPSSGEAPNPQLFGRSEALEAQSNVQSTRKRKRGQDDSKQSVELPPALDFFGDSSRHKKGKENVKDRNLASGRSKESREDASKLEAKAVSEDTSTDAASVSYSEEECKRVLRTHKLKITVLEDYKVLDQDMAVEKKSKKRRREEQQLQKSASKKTKIQLYPQPLTSFGQLRTRYSISKRLVENIESQGYTVPTEVQLGGLPLLLGPYDAHIRDYRNGENKGPAKQAEVQLGQQIDLLTIAPTGSGKTLVFLIPVLNACIHDMKSTRQDDAHSNGVHASKVGPRAIIIAPTKELAAQIVNEGRKLSQGTGVKISLMKRGMEVVERLDEEASGDGQLSHEGDSEDDSDSADSTTLERSIRSAPRKKGRAELVKAAILVTTPLALLNVLKMPSGQIAPLPTVRYLILDEADVLLDPLFRTQTLSIWNTCISPLLRISLWSATMGSNIEQLALSTVNERRRSIPSSGSEPLPPSAPLIRLVVGLKDTAIPNVAHKLIYAATEQGKLLALRQLLHPTSTLSTDTTPTLRPPFLIFTQTIPRAVALHAELLYDIPPEAGGSSRIAVLHADLPSTARDSVMARFRRGEVWVLITTDLLARGVDFRGLNGVVNYDVPNSAAAYVHRVGRTGRAGRQGGVAVTLYTTEDVPYIKNVANVIRASERLRGTEGAGAEGAVKDWLLDALPTPSKRDRQRLKKRGVEARRPAKEADGKQRAKTRISTKSGWERRVEHNRKGAVAGSRMRKAMGEGRRGRVGGRAPKGEGEGESEFEGFD